MQKRILYDSKYWDYIGEFGVCQIYSNGNKRILANNNKVCFSFEYKTKVNEIIEKRMTNGGSKNGIQ